MPDWIRILYHNLLTNSHHENVRLERTTVVIQDRRLLQIGLILRINIHLLTQWSSKIYDRIHESVVLANHHGFIDWVMLPAILRIFIDHERRKLGRCAVNNKPTLQ